MNTPLRLTYLRHATNHEAHPNDKYILDLKASCPGCIWAVDEKGEEWLLWSILSPSTPIYTIHRLDPRYPTRTDYGDIEVVGLNEKSTSEL